MILATKYYVDSCIYLNLWQKEMILVRGKPCCEIARDFFEFVRKYGNIVVYSDVMLKEIKHVLSASEFDEKSNSLCADVLFEKVRVMKKDLAMARKLEFETKFAVSFYDLVHLCIAKRLDAILVTRDAELLKVAKKHLFADKPENLIIY